jgi:hypothetical protein
MRLLAPAFVLALLVGSQAALAQDGTVSAPSGNATEQATIDPDKSAALAEVSRKRAEALQRARDAKLERLTRSICTGC